MAATTPNVIPPGTQIRNPSSLDLAYEFPSLSPPDIDRNTHIIAVCGPNDYNNQSSPITDDGWMHSDMYLFHALCRNRGYHQEYYTCVSPTQLIEKYGEFLHGNPYRTRKVVLDAAMIASGHRFSNVVTVAPRELRQIFLEKLQIEAEKCRAMGHPLVVLIFAHGCKVNYGVYIGGEGDQLEPQTPANPNLVTLQDFSAAIGQNVQVTVVSAACYSGGWTIQPNIFNTTMLAAAGPNEESTACMDSKSVGRACGSIFVSSVLRTPEFLAKPEFVSQMIGDEDPHSGIDYLAFTKTVTHVMTEHFDNKYGKQDNICFSAQDDRWRLDYRARTGLEIQEFQAPYDDLRSVSPRQEWEPGSALDRSRYGGTLGADPLNILSSALRSRFSTLTPDDEVKVYKKAVKGIVQLYMNSFPGINEKAKNRSLHSLCSLILQGQMPDGAPIEIERYEKARKQIQYRMELQKVATWVVSIEKLKAPRPCHQVCMEEVLCEAERRGEDGIFGFEQRKIYDYSLGRMLREDLFGSPTSEQGMFYEKPFQYLAMAVSQTALSLDGAEKYVSGIFKFAEEAVKGAATIPEGSIKVRDEKARWLNSLRSRMRRASPSKRGKIADVEW